ncbi:tRNA (adenine(58)-N(1))-methyltransferase non-catalytic subunit trm6 [Apophysomyces sp. BC1034]|nr:tRNA (adenine(58)-N(1))-methyltransferase non-catalytic subunit trm6 [Apophysomyces sp. BC1015]KAG0172510.1 tRNA (adenine(58)-N(1))-methyltransferase non-catalytic subunit trm6 [Apophysomyces sp. BC1021]KAG0185140.1 tRNA (adenine(58)-N(1))-methyltransferase non-catalytic subunit trm6 [Apophysomyces sp. BC1034]
MTELTASPTLTTTTTTVVPAITAQDDIDDQFPHIQAFQNVLIHMPSGNVKFVNLKPNTSVSMGKFGTFQADNLIGQPFGLSYEIYDQNGSIRPTKNWALATVEETTANNQTILDNSAVQTLTHEEIEKLKEEGLKGNMDANEIIQKMVESHSEFSKKTEYSKAKYIQRKKKKFLKVFTPVRPTLSSITKYFFTKNPDKIKNLRIDTLSQLLGMANIHAHSKVLVVDDTQGLIVAAVAERMGGFGTILGLHEGESHNYDILRYMNFSKHILDTIHTVPFSRADPADPDDAWEDKTEEELKELTDNAMRSYLRRKKAAEVKAHSRKLLFDGGFDGLIISSSYAPETVLQYLTKYLNGSRPVVIYSYHKEALLSASHWMRKSEDYLQADITESSLRQYQVLPGRTHPEMNMSASGGYLLSGLRVINCEFDPSLAPASDNNRRGKKRKAETKKTGEENTEPVSTEMDAMASEATPLETSS